MKTTTSFWAILAIATGTLLGAASGCELIASVDRNKIEGTGASTSSSTSTSTSTTSTGGSSSVSSTSSGGCTADKDCPDPMEECQVAHCDTSNGMCGKAAADDGSTAA